MENSWKSLPLRDVVLDWYGGITPSRSNAEYYSDDGGTPWVRIGDMKGRVIYSTDEHLSREGAALRRLVPGGAVLLSTSGTIGKTAIAGRKLAINQAIQAMVFNEEYVLTEYAYYYFRFFAPWLDKMSNAITISNLTRSRLMEVYIAFPIIEEQKYIINILRKAEDILEKQRIIAEKFKRYVSSVFSSMFSNAYNQRPLKELLSAPIMSGLRQRSDDGYAGFRLVNSLDDGLILSDNADDAFVNPSENELRRYSIQEGDILFRSALEGFVLAGNTVSQALFGGNLYRMRVDNSRIKPEFLMGWLQLAGRSRLLNASKNVLTNMYIPLPPISEQENFSEQFYKICALQSKLIQASRVADKAFESLLIFAFTARLSADFRREIGLSDPQYSSVFRYYHVADKKTLFEQQVDGSINWIEKLGAERAYFIDLLSKFQQAVLTELYLLNAPIPAHSLLKRLKNKTYKQFEGYSVQDAIAAVRILEAFGLIERLNLLIDEKDSALKDNEEQDITIWQYQFPDSERGIINEAD